MATTESAETQALLDIHDLHVRYGAIVALRGISFKVMPQQVVTLIGANGAGKSTTLNTISGIVGANRGTITFNNDDITGWNAAKIARAGLVQVPEGRQVIAPMTVQENLEMGLQIRHKPIWAYWQNINGWFDQRRNASADIQAVFNRFPRLEERRHQKAGSLSGGEQQMLAVGRAILAQPQLLMLDEPSMGLAPVLVNEVFNIIKDIKATGTTILLVEQNARKALEVADYAYVLEHGHIVKQGPAAVLRDDDDVIAAYLG